MRVQKSIIWFSFAYLFIVGFIVGVLWREFESVSDYERAWMSLEQTIKEKR